MQNLVGTSLGNYQIIEQLGRGGMANVYKAYHPGLALYRALKVIRPEFAGTAGFRERFQREAQAAASLRHPNVVQIHDFGEQNGLYYMVMEFLEGEDLKAVLEKRGQMRPFADIGKILSQVASALDFAHQRGIVHRDLKPGNIMITPQGQAILTDFGIAKLIDTDHKMTETGTGIGTPAYMSPEQARGSSNVGATSDVYSLGIVLFEMLTGQLPFKADTPLAVMLQVVSDPLPMPRQISPDIPDVLQGVVLKATAKNPADRYATAGALADGFAQALQGRGPQLPSDAATVVERATPQSSATQLGSATSAPAPAKSVAQTPVSSPTESAPKLTPAPKRTSTLPLWLALGTLALCMCVVLPLGFWLVSRNQGGDIVNIFQIFTGRSDNVQPTPGSGDGNSAGGVTQGDETNGQVSAGQTTTHHFTATSGQTLYFQLLESSSSVYFQLLSVDGKTELARGYNGDFGPVTLPASGEYSILASEAQTDATYTYVLHFLQPAIIENGALALDSTASGSLQTPGQTAVYNLNLQAGDTLYLDVLGDSPLEFRLILADKTLQTGYGDDFGPFTATIAGDYLLEVDGNGAKTGSYEFKLWNVPPAVTDPALALDETASGQIAIPGQTARYTLNLTAGQWVYFDSLGEEHNLEYRLYPPFGDQPLFTQYGGDSNQASEILTDGEYVLEVDGSGDTLGTYNFILRNVPPAAPGTALTLNQLTEGQITVPGQELWYNISLTAGQFVLLEVEDTGTSFTYTLYEPNTYDEVQTFYGSANDPLPVPATGEYRLVLRTGQDAVGKTAFTLWDVTPAEQNLTANVGGTLTGSIDVPGQVVRYTVNLTAGQRVKLTGVSNSFSGYISLFAPDGKTEIFYSYGGDTEAVEIPADGVYQLVINPDGADTGTYQMTLQGE
ncbi:MAG TPA: protein kinase [Anaerolineales bacterium]|nr:protein kinase [Anaerolineales bacterium]